ncbi:MAG: DEAD/DEAH box helicase [Verrucomicrobia bacterium]|nr:DEAD/DEAH box helicase [Verrucomicrobiota bacterium]
MARPKRGKPSESIPTMHDWRTTDEQELARRRQRAAEESFWIKNLQAAFPVFSNFEVGSPKGGRYAVEIRDLRSRQFSCSCVDFRINGLGTCKHVEATLLHLGRKGRGVFKNALNDGSGRWDVVPDAESGALRLIAGSERVPAVLKRWFDRSGRLISENPEEALRELHEMRESRLPLLRISQEVSPWLEARERAEERVQLRREYESKVQSGEWPAHETLVPLFPYQREGMLHLAFTERGLLADEMGLGKTIQAIAACALARRMGRARRALIVTPASLKTEWEEQIQRFTSLPYQLVFGPRHDRLKAYNDAGADAEGAPFFTVVNYEQMLQDSLDVNERARPDIVVLDEAQRIKNWSTKTSQAVKRLRSRYAFVLTGTPIENRIDEIHSLMDFLDPAVLGPLFRFNREFYDLDERGRPQGYKNLARLNEKIRPYMLRRRKCEVETELPDRVVRNHFVAMSTEQQAEYQDHESAVARLSLIAQRRPLTQQEQEKLLRELAMMRMVCDTVYILDQNHRECPKLAELEKVLEECRDNPGVKIIIFSEWERMLELVRGLCEELNLGFAWHTGSVPQKRRRAEINAFKSDPACRVFLSTDAGATGLNLQNASVVVNCDLPWNPAKLEQRIARAWRKHQTRTVTVINLVSEKTIEHRMLDTLANKQALADGVLDRQGDLDNIAFKSGRQAFLSRLEQILTPNAQKPSDEKHRPSSAPLPTDRSLGFAEEAAQALRGQVLRCEERFPSHASHSVVYIVVERNAEEARVRLQGLQDRYFGSENSDPLSPVHCEVVDRTTDEALQRMMTLGLIAPQTRGNRQLFPSLASSEQKPVLSPGEAQELRGHQEVFARRLKMGRVLMSGGM